MSPRRPGLADVAPWLFVLLWSTGFVGAKFGLPYAEPFTLLLIRMLLTLAVFLCLILWFKSPWPTLPQAGHQLVVGALVHGAYLGGVFAAIKLALPAGVTSLLVGLQPVLTAVFGWLWLGDRLRLRQWIGLGLGVVGVALVLLSGRQLALFQIQPAALAFAGLALVGISLGTVYQKRFGAGVSLLTGTFCQYVATAILMAVLAFAFERRQVVWHPHLVGALLWLVFGLSLSAILLLMLMIRHGQTARVASYFYLVPPVTALETWLVFGEHLAPLGLVGMAAAATGVYLVLRPGGGTVCRPRRP
ncbi:MAG: EamA family transporter [Deferrisomatales bacterium]|nr:EamA family transporter [Deferrisomatales bacterium]